MNGKLIVKVFRFDPEKEIEPRYDTYEVPFEHGMRVINAIHYIQENFDGTLAFRANCRSGRCGSDAVEVNGLSVLACKHEIKSGTEEITIAPLKSFPVIKDLVVDFSKAYEYAKDIPCFIPDQSEKEFWKIKQEEIQEIRELRKCIECFICHNVCHVIRDHQVNYVGPRFVVKAAALDKHPKDTYKKRSELLKEKGIWTCNISRCCQENCPEKIRIADDAIIYEKESGLDTSLSLKEAIKFFRKLKK